MAAPTTIIIIQDKRTKKCKVNLTFIAIQSIDQVGRKDGTINVPEKNENDAIFRCNVWNSSFLLKRTLADDDIPTMRCRWRFDDQAYRATAPTPKPCQTIQSQKNTNIPH